MSSINVAELQSLVYLPLIQAVYQGCEPGVTVTALTVTVRSDAKLLADRYVKPLLAQGFLREKSRETNIMYELTIRGERLHSILSAAQKELVDAILMPA